MMTVELEADDVTEANVDGDEDSAAPFTSVARTSAEVEMVEDDLYIEIRPGTTQAQSTAYVDR